MDFGKVENVEKIDFSMPQDHPHNKQLFDSLEAVQQPKVYIGCPAWADKSFVEKIYPAKAKNNEYLTYYSKNFSTIEFNSTYYAIPKKETILGWKEKALPGFKFCPKVPSEISHDKQMVHATKITQLFADAISLWQEYLGICFLVLPPSFAPNRSSTLVEYIANFPLPLAIEFRHPQWFQNTVTVANTFHELQNNQIATVITDVAGRRDVLHQRVTSNTVVIRFVGNDLHASDYRRLDDWVQRLHHWTTHGVENIYFFVHQPQSALAIDASIYFVNKLREQCNINAKLPQLLKLDIQQTFFQVKLMDKIAIYKQHLTQMENQAFEFLYELVNINSQTKNAHGVNVVGQKCIDLFALMGFTAEIFPSQLDPTYGDYVFLTHPGESKKNIALVSHLDTVYSVEEEKNNDFFLREEGERLYGPGVSDIKGGTMVMFMVLKTLKDKNPQLFNKYTWHVLLNAREEEGTEEFSQLAAKYVTEETQAVLVYEAGGIEAQGSNIVTARKGVARFYMETVGRQAHSGTDHHRGANALLELAHKIVAIEQETCYKRGLTFNVGEAQGGVAINRVPDHAYCYIDIRTKTQQDFDFAVDFIHRFAGDGVVKSSSGDFQCTTIVKQMPSYPCWPQNENSDKLAQVFVEAGKDLGQHIDPKPRAGASDGSSFWQIAPTVDGLGPLGANDHCSIHKPQEGKEQEYIIKSSLCERALLNIVAIEKWLNS